MEFSLLCWLTSGIENDLLTSSQYEICQVKTLIFFIGIYKMTHLSLPSVESLYADFDLRTNPTGIK